MLTPVQYAYGLLWRSSTDCGLAQTARRVLLEALTLEERREAVKWIIEDAGPMSTSELIAADMRAGVFPQRSYDPS